MVIKKSRKYINQKSERNLSSLLPNFLQNFEENYKRNPSIIVQYFMKLLGEKIAPMVKVKSFEKETLIALVENSTLYSLLNNYEKDKLLMKMQKKFSKEMIKKIIFKIG